jgi:RND family efflux transporter MFP subunit
MSGLALAAGCGSAPTEEEPPPPAPVTVQLAQKEVMGEWTELLGTTEPLPGKGAHLSAAVAGQVVSVLGDGKKAIVEGQEVAKDQVIVRLDDTVARANLNRAQSALGELAEQGKQAKYAVSLAKIEVESLEKALGSGTSGGATGFISPIELDKKRLLLKDAESRERAVIDKVNTAKAELKVLQAQLDLYTLRAPIAGRLGQIHVALGQTLAVGAQVAEILDLGEIDVLCFVPPHVVGKLRPDQPARLGGLTKATGKVRFIAVQAQTETGSFAVKVHFPNSGLHLRSGRVQRVEIETQPSKERLVIPETALLEDQEPPRVVVVEHKKVEEKGKEEEVEVARLLIAKLGVREPGKRAELLGLRDPETKEEFASAALASARFVVTGGHGLETGDRVKVATGEKD